MSFIHTCWENLIELPGMFHKCQIVSEAMHNLCLILKIMLKNYVLSTTEHFLQLQVHTQANIPTCSVTQSECPIFRVFLILLIYF
jgi:hypothetical protein